MDMRQSNGAIAAGARLLEPRCNLVQADASPLPEFSTTVTPFTELNNSGYSAELM
jgi:hypothetical protein